MSDLPAAFFFRLSRCLLGMLPEETALALGEAAGYLASFLDSRRLRMAERHMRRVLGDESKTRRAARAVFSNYGRYYAELFWVKPHRLEVLDRDITVEGVDYLRAARNSGRGIILASPHIGNWDIGARLIIAEGIRISVVAEALSWSPARDFFASLRRILGMEVLLLERGSSLVISLARKLRAGEAVALLADRDIRGDGIEVLFFGEATTLPSGPAALAEFTGAPIIPAATYFKPGRGHRVVFRPPLIPPEGGDSRERLRSMTQRLALTLEAFVREAPTQWHMLQPNWPSDREPT